jgi:predicted transcriptional regulator
MPTYLVTRRVDAGHIIDAMSLAGTVTSVIEVASGPAPGDAPVAEPTPPRVPQPSPAQIKASIKPDELVSFEDGKSYKTLRRHLTGYGLTPEQYREKWGLPRDYPVVAPNYSARRSELAKANGLGKKR